MNRPAGIFKSYYVLIGNGMEIADILNNTSHRQYQLPEKPWKQYQEWHGSLFMHWKIDPSILKGLLPESLTIDLYDNDAWISILAFAVKKLRFRRLPCSRFSSNFNKVILRTYVINNGIPGVYFFSIEAEKLMPAFMERVLVGLPYIKSTIYRKGQTYYAENADKNLSLQVDHSPGELIYTKSGLDLWLTERHALYYKEGNNIFRTDIHHKEWILQNTTVRPNIIRYPIISDMPGQNPPDLAHCARRVKVLFWAREKI